MKLRTRSLDILFGNVKKILPVKFSLLQSPHHPTKFLLWKFELRSLLTYGYDFQMPIHCNSPISSLLFLIGVSIQRIETSRVSAQGNDECLRRWVC
jgi:hypothetical protein